MTGPGALRPHTVATRAMRLRRYVLSLVAAVSLPAGMILASTPAAATASSTYAVTEVPVGEPVNDVAVDPATDTVYASYGNQGLAVIDGADNSVTAHINFGPNTLVPEAVAVDQASHTVYAIGGSSTPTADAINGATDAVTASISLPSRLEYLGAAVNPDTHMVYLGADSGQQSVIVIDGNTNTVAATIPLGSTAFGVAVDTATNTIYATLANTNQVAVIDGSTNTVTGMIDLPAGAFPDGVAVDPAAGLVYVVDRDAGAISVIDTASDSVSTLTTGMTPASIGANAPAAGMALDAASGTLYVADQGSSTYVIDAASGVITEQIPRVGNSVAVPLTGGSAYVGGNYGSGSSLSPGAVTVMTPSAASTMSPVITADPAYDFTVGQASQFQLVVSATPAATVSTAGLPAGLSISPSGLLAGTPASGTTGTHLVTVTASNGVAPAASDEFDVDVTGVSGPAITSADHATFTVGVAGSFAVTATGDPAPTFSETGTLPTGLNFNAFGVLSGTPLAGTESSYPITITEANSSGTATQAFTLNVSEPSGSYYTPVGPVRVLDTRNGTGTGGIISPVFPGNFISLQVTGVDGVPTTGVTAVVLNVTVTDTTANSYLAVCPDTQPCDASSSSNLNWTAGETIPNLVTVPVGADGKVNFFNAAGNTDVIADLEGYYSTASGGSSYFPAGPVRVLDTRNGTGTGGVIAPVGSAGLLKLQVDGVDGVPASGVSAVVLNVTVTDTTKAAYLAVCPDGQTCNAQSSSNLNWAAGETIPNLVTVPVGTDGKVDFFNAAGNTDIVADLAGYYSTASGGSQYFPAGPQRILDTRNGTGGFTTPVGSGGLVALPVDGVAGVPASGVTAVAMNVTVTDTTKAAYLAVCPDGQTCNAQSSSNLNWTAGETIPNLVVVPVGADGKVDFFNAAGNTDVIADQEGYFASP